RVFLAADPEVREVSTAFRADQLYRFRVEMNLSKKSKEHRKTVGGVDAKGMARSQGKRVALTWDSGRDRDEAIREWFVRKAEGKGFAVEDFFVLRVGWKSAYKPGAYME